MSEKGTPTMERKITRRLDWEYWNELVFFTMQRDRGRETEGKRKIYMYIFKLFITIGNTYVAILCGPTL